MAKSKSTNSPLSRDVIERRVETQRKRVWQAQAICRIASRAAQELSAAEAQVFANDAWLALDGVSELLDDIARQLDGGVVLAQMTPGEKAEEAVREARR